MMASATIPGSVGNKRIVSVAKSRVFILVSNRLFLLVTLPTFACDTAKMYTEHEQQQRLLQFLMGLNESYTPIRSQILMTTPMPSVSQAFSITSQEESRCSLLTAPSSMTETQSSVCYSSQVRFNAPKSGSNAHMPGGEPPPEEKSDSNGAFFTLGQHAEILKLLEKTHVTPKKDTPHVVNMAGLVQSSSCCSSWIVDSGVNNHMVGNSLYAHDSLSCDTSIGMIRLPNGGSSEVAKVGPVTLTNHITLPNTLYIPF